MKKQNFEHRRSDENLEATQKLAMLFAKKLSDEFDALMEGVPEKIRANIDPDVLVLMALSCFCADIVHTVMTGGVSYEDAMDVVNIETERFSELIHAQYHQEQ